MAIRPSDLRVVPLFEGITDAHLTELTDAFERLTLPKGSVLFEAKSAPTHFLLLAKGEVALQQQHETRFVLAPIAPIGELGSLTGAHRSTTAVTTAPSEIWRIGTDALVAFFERHGDVAYPFFHNLVHIVSDKIRRDARRVEEMRDNLIRTQKAMKALLERVLEMEETPLSRTVAETLEDLIEHNRRGHYLVEPSRTLKGSARLDDGTVVVVEAISEGWVRLGRHPSPPPVVGARWSGVLVIPSGEIPLSGAVESATAGQTLVKLDLLIDEYAARLREYLTRVQMLDFV